MPSLDRFLRRRWRTEAKLGDHVVKIDWKRDGSFSIQLPSDVHPGNYNIQAPLPKPLQGRFRDQHPHVQAMKGEVVRGRLR